METKKYQLLCLSVLFQISLSFGQNKENGLTAQQIIQKAIDVSGGDELFNRFRNLEATSQVETPKHDTISFAIKKSDMNRYLITTLSVSYANNTLIFNSGRSISESDQRTTPIQDPVRLEELRLQAYISLEYGYKKLGYTFKKETDQKFQNFDCFTLLVSSPLGRTTINYYDKVSGKLIMMFYPNMSRSIFIDHQKANGITYPSKVLMVDSLGAVTISTLTELNFPDDIDSNWFRIRKPGVSKAPSTFKSGTFKYLASNLDSKIIRDTVKQVEINGNSRTEYKIKWSTENEYLIFKLKDISKPPTNDNILFIKVRIISWTNDRYYCHYLSSSNVGGTCAFAKLD